MYLSLCIFVIDAGYQCIQDVDLTSVNKGDGVCPRKDKNWPLNVSRRILQCLGVFSLSPINICRTSTVYWGETV